VSFAIDRDFAVNRDFATERGFAVNRDFATERGFAKCEYIREMPMCVKICAKKSLL
jgi:hypothetical protein